MSMRLMFSIALVLTLAAGCQSNPRMNAHVELLNAEKRAIEDELYSLQFDYEDALRELKDLTKENERLRRGGAPRLPARDSADRTDRPDLELRQPEIDEGMLTEPKVEIPGESSPAPRDLPAPKPPSPSVLNNSAPPTPPAGARKTDGASNWLLEPADPRVTHIHLNPLLTGGTDIDRQPGDDGINVIIEPRNADDAFVPLAGPVSVVLLDPAKEGEQSRVARWDLDASQAERALENSQTVRGIRLQLPWPQAAPANGRLKLFVRYVTVDGRKLETSREIFVTLPGQYSQRWTPRSSARTNSIAQISPPTDPMAPSTDSDAKVNTAEHTQLSGEMRDKAREPVPVSHHEEPSFAKERKPPSAEAAPLAAPEWRPYR